jgi:elongation factor G
MAFKIAGAMALKEAAKKASPALLEPVMEFEVTTARGVPRRRDGRCHRAPGAHREHRRRAGQKIIRVVVPLAELFGYATDLRSKTQGRARTVRCSCTRTTRSRCRSRKRSSLG